MLSLAVQAWSRPATFRRPPARKAADAFVHAAAPDRGKARQASPQRTEASRKRQDVPLTLKRAIRPHLRDIHA